MWSGHQGDAILPSREPASCDRASAKLAIDVFMVGGGRSRLEIEAYDLNDISERLRRERSLVGRLLALNEEEAEGRVLLPAHRVALILEA